jgi:hypothetical protein
VVGGEDLEGVRIDRDRVGALAVLQDDEVLRGPADSPDEEERCEDHAHQHEEVSGH